MLYDELERFFLNCIELQIDKLMDARKRSENVLLLWLISELQCVSINTLNFSRMMHYGVSTQNITYLP